MHRKVVILAATLCIFLLSPAMLMAHGHHHKSESREQKQGILLTTFGTSYPKAQKAFENIEKKVQKTYPDTPFRWAYTAKFIRDKLASNGGNIPSPAQALANMKDQGFTSIAVQSLHVIKGYEYQNLKSVVEGFKSMHGEPHQLMLGAPLLSGPDSLEEVRDCIMDNIPASRKKDQAVIFMGHGTHHPSNAFYQAMAYQFQQEDSLVFLGTIGGTPGLESIIASLENRNVQKVYLMPFMSVAGDHARNDMAGSGEDSWKSVLQKKGYQVRTVLKGMAEYDNIVDIWLDNLEDTTEHFHEDEDHEH